MPKVDLETHHFLRRQSVIVKHNLREMSNRNYQGGDRVLQKIQLYLDQAQGAGQEYFQNERCFLLCFALVSQNQKV